MTDSPIGPNGVTQQASPAMPVQQVQQPRPAQPPRIPASAYLGAINAAMEIAGTRIMGLLGLLGALAVFGYAMYDPTPLRTYTSVAYAFMVLWPMVYLYLSKGQPS